MPQSTSERDYLIVKGLDILKKHYEVCEAKDADTSLTPEGIINIFSNAFDQEDVKLSKSEVNDIMEAEGYKGRLIGQTYYWLLRTRKD